MRKSSASSLKILMIAVSILSVVSGCKSPKSKSIETIYVFNCYMTNYFEDIIDLVNKQHLEAGPLSRPHSADYYTFVNDLDDLKISEFLRMAAKYDFLSWDDEYIPDGIIHDGHQWGIEIHFSDSTEKTVYGDNNYPATWDEMSIAFEDLTGSIIIGAGRSRE